MKQTEPALTYEEAYNRYFGAPSFQMVCSCKYRAINLKDCWKHIRKSHGERIRNKFKSEKEIENGED